MSAIFGLFATPLGWVMSWIYSWVGNYFLTLLVFTLLTRLLLFPLSINNQKSQADRARLAPRLERLQKKFGQDRQKFMEKQQALYEKEGVSMTGGCLPMLVQMLVLFSVIAVIYKPLTYIQRMPEGQIETCISVAVEHMDKEEDKDRISQMQSEGSYYRELYLFNEINDTTRPKMVAALIEKNGLSEEAAIELVADVEEMGKQFSIGDMSLLTVPYDDWQHPDWTWIIVLMSGLTALLSSLLSMHYSKAAMPKDQQQAAGCTNGMMYMMPVMSLIFSFSVPAGVALYWTFSNLLAMVQTAVLNAMWNPAKIRAKAEADYAERRRKKREDRERLRESRLAEQAEWQEEEKRARARKKGDITQKKSAAPTDTPAELPDQPADETETPPADDTTEEE